MHTRRDHCDCQSGLTKEFLILRQHRVHSIASDLQVNWPSRLRALPVTVDRQATGKECEGPREDICISITNWQSLSTLVAGSRCSA